MGINKFHPFVKGICPEVYENIHISEYAYKKVAVDISGYVNKYKRSTGDKWLSQILNLVVCLRKCEIHCVFIYDGGAPPEKAEERKRRISSQEKIEQRTVELKDALDHYYESGEILPILVDFSKKIKSKSPERLLVRKPKGIDMTFIAKKIEKRLTYTQYPTKHDFELTKQLMDILKVPWFVAPLEAETVCADLCKRGIVDAVLSEDTDLMAYGTPNFLFEFSPSHCNCKRLKYTKVIDGLKLEPDTFLDLCIMGGTDYNPNIPNIGLNKAYKLLKDYKDIDTIGLNTELDISVLNHERTRELFTNYEQTIHKIKYCGVPDYKALNVFNFKHNIHFNVEGLRSSFERTDEIEFEE